MQIAISKRKLILLALIIVAVIVVVALALRPARGEGPDTRQTPGVQGEVLDLGSRLAAGPEEMTMHDGVPAVKGLATHEGTGESGEFIVVRTESGKEFRFLVPTGTNIFRSSDVPVNSPIPGVTPAPAPTVEIPTAVLRGMKDTLVLVRYDNGDPPVARSILIIEVAK